MLTALLILEKLSRFRGSSPTQGLTPLQILKVPLNIGGSSSPLEGERANDCN